MEKDTENPPEEKQLTPQERSIAAGTKNLIPMKPGQVLNPNGRPKGSKNRKTLFRELLEQAAFSTYTEKQKNSFGKDFNPQTAQEQLVAQLFVYAMAGEVKAAEIILDSAFDKLTDKTQHTGNIGVGAILDSVSKKGPDALPKMAGKKEQGEETCKAPSLTKPILNSNS